MNCVKYISAITIALLSIGCVVKKEATSYLTFTPEIVSDTVRIVHENTSTNTFGAKTFNFFIESEPSLNAMDLSAVILDSKGVRIQPQEQTITVLMIPNTGPINSTKATVVVTALPNALPGFYTVHISGSNSKKSANIIKTIQVI